ncbi:GDYXXLXY domain-containing protein [Paenibacillus sp.]|uniref:GDYXXLXY domain-containing protein n=1 Tax=Paenibacillus sp. TaxID=58172 RepID=UPI002810DAA2|nr:GDYXXLXY domain-containing protein [Paenibacillus sp.]
MTKFRWFAILVLAQAIFLLGLAVSSYAAVWFGKEVRLQTVPVDPRDILYGDYVTLSYNISRLSPSLWRGEALPEEGDAIYVAVAPKGDVFAAVAAYPSRVAVPPEQALIKGLVTWQWEQEIVVRYGLERYYVPEGAGLALEERAADLIVVAKIAPWGRATLTDVLTKK